MAIGPPGGEGEAGVRLQRHRAAAPQIGIAGDAEPTVRHVGSALVAAMAREGQDAGPGLGQRSRAPDRAAIAAVGALVEDQAGIVGDVALQAVGRALQRAGADQRTARIAAAGEDHRAGSQLGQRSRALDGAAIAAGGALVEDQAGIVGDVVLEARGGALQHAAEDVGAAAVVIGACQHQRAAVDLGQLAVAGEVPPSVAVTPGSCRSFRRRSPG